MTDYVGLRYFTDQTIPECREPGIVRIWEDRLTPTAVLTTADSIKMARMPAGHVPLKVELVINGDWDTGANTLAVKIGTTADDDLVVAAAVIGNGDRYYSFPTDTAGGSAFGATTSALALHTTAAPSTIYDIIMVPTANATTLSTGTGIWRIHYTAIPSVVDPSNSPAVVTA